MPTVAPPSPEAQTPPFGVLGKVDASADTTRVDFAPSDFDAQIEAHGKRLAWTRSIRCPCLPLNSQTGQVDPDCKLCHGLAWTYFGPSRSQALPDQTLTPVQAAYVEKNNAFVIRGVVTGSGKQDKPWDTIGSWRMGMASVTVRRENVLGFQDRIAVLDDRIVFTEVVTVKPGHVGTLPLRYWVAGGVYMLRSETRIFVAGRDFAVRAGRLAMTRPVDAADCRLAVHYVTYPVFLVMDLPNVSRETSVEDGQGLPQTGIGQSAQLPIRGTLRLEFLPPVSDQGDPR